MSDKYSLFNAMGDHDEGQVVSGGVIIGGTKYSIGTILQTLWFAIELAQDNESTEALIHAISLLHSDIGKDDYWEDVVSDLIRKHEDIEEGISNE